MTILLTAPYHEEGQQYLEKTLGKVISRPWKDHGRAFNSQELIALLQETGADALITEHDEVSSAVIEAFPELRFIGVCRGTPSNVSLETAALKGIPVFHTPARNAQAVAELFLATVIDMLRFVFEGSSWLKGGGWGAGAHTSYLQFKGNELAGKTIGMVGFGAVGQRIAEMVENFPCKIIFYDPYLQDFNPKYSKVSVEEVFATADIVSVHLPVTADTVAMIDQKLISLMKKDAIFVNTARASVVVREDLCYALENKLIRGAILDVFDHEPPDATDQKIINLPNVLATPHIAGATDEVEDHHVEILNRKIINWFAAEKVKLDKL